MTRRQPRRCTLPRQRTHTRECLDALYRLGQAHLLESQHLSYVRNVRAHSFDPVSLTFVFTYSLCTSVLKSWRLWMYRPPTNTAVVVVVCCSLLLLLCQTQSSDAETSLSLPLFSRSHNRRRLQTCCVPREVRIALCDGCVEALGVSPAPSCFVLKALSAAAGCCVRLLVQNVICDLPQQQ